MEKIFKLNCKSCGWFLSTTGVSTELEELKLAEIKKCAKCGGPRTFKCQKCGKLVKMLRKV